MVSLVSNIQCLSIVPSKGTGSVERQESSILRIRIYRLALRCTRG